MMEQERRVRGKSWSLRTGWAPPRLSNRRGMAELSKGPLHARLDVARVRSAKHGALPTGLEAGDITKGLERAR